MAKKTATTELRVVGVKATTIGTLQGTLFALVGLVTAITFSASKSAHLVSETDSLLRGLTFGLASGFIVIISLPIIYFAIGWVIGWLQGIVLNIIVSLAGGVVFKTEK